MSFISLKTTRWKDGKWLDSEQTIPTEDIKSIERYNKSDEQKSGQRHQDVEMSKVYLKSNKPKDPYQGYMNKEAEEKALFLIVLRAKEDMDALLSAIQS